MLRQSPKIPRPTAVPPSLRPLHLRLLGHFERVVDLDSQVPHGALDLAVTEEQLHCSKVFVRL